MKAEQGLLRRRFSLWYIAIIALAITLLVVSSALAAHVTGGADVEVINDNNNVDGGTPNPGFDAQNRQSNETTVAISPANPNIVAAGANDYRMALLAKQQTPEQARIVKEAGGSVLEMDESFDRAWRRVGLALDRVGFVVEDRDRSKGVYFVRYIDPGVDNAQAG